MCKHVCSNKIVYFTISVPAVASLLPTDNISMALFLKGLGGLLQLIFLHMGQGLALHHLSSKH